MTDSSTWKVSLSENGTFTALAVGTGDQFNPILVRSDDHAGPCWYGEWDGGPQRVELKAVGPHPQTLSPDGERGEDGSLPIQFEGAHGSLSFSLSYHTGGDRLAIVSGLRNNGLDPFRPVKCGLKLGLDCYMESYPEWDNKLFPTLLRCEPAHFWGYLMSPAGRILGMASPDPVASWSLDYNYTIYEGHWAGGLSADTPWNPEQSQIEGEGVRHEGHRIYTLNLDLLNAPPLPSRHPSGLSELAPGEERRWTIYLLPVPDLGGLKPLLAEVCAAPMLELERYTLSPGEITRLYAYGGTPAEVVLTGPDGHTYALSPVDISPTRSVYLLAPSGPEGIYTLTVRSTAGKAAEAKLYVRRPWSWYLRQARVEAVRKSQKASTHMETWLGCFSTYLARSYFPDPEVDIRAEANFRAILPLMFDTRKAEPITDPARIQNTAAMLGLLADVYTATGNEAAMDLATRLADWLILSQGADGSYRADHGRGVHYTSVTYIAKYMLELALVEKEMVKKSDAWRARYERHYASAKAAIDDLERRKDNIGTEGEHTFEDGMISCTALQLGMFALLQEDPAAREKYTAAARSVLDKHRCLEQLAVPDARMRGATLRFWEAQYDVLIRRNMLNSPHGWTSWKTYATWYLYLLSGEEAYLRNTMDTLGACMQVVDLSTSSLRWGFVPDPYLPGGSSPRTRRDQDPAGR